MAQTNQILNKLKQIFRIADAKPSETRTQKQLYPGYADKKSGKVRPVKFSDEIQQLYEAWISDNFEDADSLRNRKERYASLSYAYYNNSIFSKAVNLYTDETVQADMQDQIIGVSAKRKKVENYIKDFLDEIEASDSNHLRDVAFNLVLYGDSFWINSINYDEKRIDSITPLSVQDVEQRIEFNASEFSKKKSKYRKFSNFIQKDSVLQALSKIMQDTVNKQDYAQYFKSYLFGFHLGDKIYLAPWNMCHFRMYTTINEFYPFGRPIMINSLAPFRQLQAGKNLMALARANNFPVRDFEVEVDENMDLSDQWEAVDDAKEQLHNMGNELQTGKEQFAIGGEIWHPSGLVTMNWLESRMNLDDIADIEMLRDDLVMGTDIPKGYLIIDRGSFGTSGQALLKQHKPFARAVYKVQTAILKQLTQLIRLQFVISGDYSYDEPFELTMQFPEVEESSDRLRLKSDMLRLAKDVLDNLGDAIGLDRGESLPPDVAKDILAQISFLDNENVEQWINQAVQQQQQGGKEGEGEEGGLFGSYRKYVSKLDEKLQRINSYIIRECYYKAKRQGRTRLYEASSNNKHFYSSFKIDPQEKQLLELIYRDKNNKLEE